MEYVSDDLLLELISKLDMIDIVKLSFLNPRMYELCNKNDIWGVCYNKLFDRRIITNNAIHNDAVTWFRCRCIPYPGWVNIHREINNDKLVCKRLDHYTNLESKIMKNKYKCYKKKTKQRYIQLLKNDSIVKTNYVIQHDIYKSKNELKHLQSKIHRLEYQNKEYEKVIRIINT